MERVNKTSSSLKFRVQIVLFISCHASLLPAEGSQALTVKHKRFV